jgi:hypothetical protein
MKRSVTLIPLFATALVLAACERESSTVVTTPPTQTAEAPQSSTSTTTTVPVPVPVPGPAGPQGEPGKTGAPGAPGDTQVIVVPPASDSASAPK